jgi:FtsP/CotA-like multicopper oxidase with cupredoxin domain
MLLHDGSLKIVATEGNPVPAFAQLTKDTLAVHPGKRYDIESVANNPGQWAFHWHILHCVANDDVGPEGLLMVIYGQ